MNSMTDILPSIQIKPGIPSVSPPRTGQLWNGLSQPPRNITADSAAIRIMLAYSARKNSAKPMPEYSVWKPATIVASSSARSNGARLVSATPAMKYTTNIGNSGMKYQPSRPENFHPNKVMPACCPRTMSPRFMLCATSSTHTSANPMANSYDTICAAERKAPRKAYLEFEAQPAMIMPYTPSEVI